MADIATLSVLLKLRDEATPGLTRFADDVKKHTQAIGIAFTAIGGSITAVAALAVKSSLEQQVGINRLDQALKNVGESYEGQKGAIEAVINAQQRKTNYSDEQQRDALQKLVTVGGQWAGSLDALKVVTDVAAGANIDLNAAALLVGKAIAGETGSLSRYGIVLKEGATQTEIMAALTEQFGGAAEAAANPMIQLKNRLDDMLQVMGNALLPIVIKAAQVMGDIATRVQEWAEAHPQLAKWLSIVAAGIGGVMLVVGPLLIALPALIAGVGALGAVIAVATGPIGLITLAVTALVAGAVLLWRNWEAVWNGIKGVTEKAVNGVIWVLNKAMDGLASYLETAKKVLDAIPGANPLGAFMQQGIDALRAGIGEIDLTGASMGALADSAGAMAGGVGTAMGQASESTGRFSKAAAQSAKEAANAYIELGKAILEGVKFSEDQRFNLMVEAETRRKAEEAKQFDDRRNMYLKIGEDISAGLKAGYVRDFNLMVQNAADKVNFEERVAANIANVARGLAAQNEQVASQNASSLQRIQDGIARGWDSIRARLDPFLAKLREFGVGAEQVVQQWAMSVGTSADNVIMFLQRAGIAHDDLKAIVQQAALAMGMSYDALIEKARTVSNAVAPPRALTPSEEMQRQIVAKRDFFNKVVGEIVSSNLGRPIAEVNAQIAAFRDERLDKMFPGVPGFAHGGTVPGPVGMPQLAVVHGGETVTPTGRAGGGGVTVNVTVNGDVVAEHLYEHIQRVVLDTVNGGGFPQLARA